MQDDKKFTNGTENSLNGFTNSGLMRRFGQELHGSADCKFFVRFDLDEKFFIIILMRDCLDVVISTMVEVSG